GVPPRDDDIDLYLRPAHAEQALEALVAAGLRPEHPPEGWLLKAHDGRVLVDLIFSPSGLDIDDELFERADDLQVEGMTLPVVAVDDVVASQLLSWTEHHL